MLNWKTRNAPYQRQKRHRQETAALDEHYEQVWFEHLHDIRPTNESDRRVLDDLTKQHGGDRGKAYRVFAAARRWNDQLGEKIYKRKKL